MRSIFVRSVRDGEIEEIGGGRKNSGEGGEYFVSRVRDRGRNTLRRGGVRQNVL